MFWLFGLACLLVVSLRNRKAPNVHQSRLLSLAQTNRLNFSLCPYWPVRSWHACVLIVFRIPWGGRVQVRSSNFSSH